MKTNPTLTADTLNTHLKNDGVVQVTTYLKSWLYTAKHAGYFVEKNGFLYVKSGKRLLQLSNSNGFMVGIRTGKYISEK